MEERDQTTKSIILMILYDAMGVADECGSMKLPVLLNKFLYF